MSATPPSPHILIVDDDRVMGELLVALLAHHGYAVTHAHSGAEALQIIDQLGPRLDIVLCDIHMPGLSGSELVSTLIEARATRALPSETLLLGMSGSAPSQAEVDLFDRFLQKPFTVEDVAKAIEQARAGSTREAAASPAAEARDSTLPPLDERTFTQLRSKLPDDQLHQLYAMTLDDVQQRLERMTTAAEQDDHDAVRREAHTIKGSCGMVGALELQHLAAATEGGSALDTSALADFSRACQRLQRMLDERL